MTPIISLNDLPNTPHNLLFKVFASKVKQKKVAFDKIKDRRADVMSGELSALIIGLQKIMLSKEFEMATETITSEEIKRIGRAWAERMMQDIPVEKRLEGVSLEERLKDVSDEELSKLLEARRKAARNR